MDSLYNGIGLSESAQNFAVDSLMKGCAETIFSGAYDKQCMYNGVQYGIRPDAWKLAVSGKLASL
jgi:hypothetical protein